MMKYFWSALNNSFLADPLLVDYQDAGWNLSDIKEVDIEVFNEFTTLIPDKVRVVGNDGMPAWGSPPAPTHAQKVAAAEQKKESLLSQATATTSDWRTELALGVIDDADKEKLVEWMQYIKAVKEVDTAIASDIVWPAAPAE